MVDEIMEKDNELSTCLYGNDMKREIIKTLTLHNSKAQWSETRGVILTLTLHNNDTTPRHNVVVSMCESHSIVPWCCVIVV
jgi:hypothetical protein